DWVYYPEKRLPQDRFLISTEGKLYDVVRDREVSGNFMGEAKIKYAQVCDESGWPIKISVAKALLYTFIGMPPNGKPTTKIKFLDCDRRNVVITNVRWKG
ncbi:MAG: hypothetical protein ACRC7S_00800, partial [Cetobacterium sp.]